MLLNNSKRANKTKNKTKDEFITRDIGFELIFGYRDTLDIPEYKESEGIREMSLPKNINISEHE